VAEKVVYEEAEAAGSGSISVAMVDAASIRMAM